jgi:predicted amidohydrolase YtcJ
MRRPRDAIALAGATAPSHLGRMHTISALRRVPGRAVRLLAVLCLAAPVAAPAQQPAPVADLIVRNARIWTGDSTRPAAQALAVRGERLVAVGSNDEVERHRGPGTRVIDVGGRMVTPGFIDNHTHFSQAGALLIGANLLDVHEPALLAARVKAAAARMSPGAWLTGGDWGAYEDNPANSTGAQRPAGAPRPRFSPDRSIIDSVSGGTPVLLNRWDRTAYLANGLALEQARLSCDRPVRGLDCAGGRATGRVSDSALAQVRRAIAPRTFDQQLREARAAQQHLAELGVTTIHDITPPTQLPVYTEMERRGELTVRVFARPTLDKWDDMAYVGIAPGFGSDWVRVRALKGFVDGIQGNSTARFYEPQLHSGRRGEWRDSTNTGASSGPGSGMMPAGNMERLLFALDSAGWWANVHAIGDEAIDSTLDIMEKVFAVNGPKERRWRIIHSQVIRDASVAARYKRLGIIAEVQPYHAIDDMRWMEERIGDRSRWAYAFRTFHDAGVPLLFGSDWPGTNASWYTADPMMVLYAAVTRQTVDGKPEGGWFPQERLDLETALRAYTVNNAWAEGEEASKGSLTAGKLADFVIIDRDLFAIPATQLKEARVLLTAVGGRIVHAAGAFAGAGAAAGRIP